MENLRGLTLTGLQSSVADASGDGSLSGTVDVAIDSGVDLFIAAVGYDGILIEGTVPSSSTYTVSVNGATGNVDYTVLNPGSLYFTDLIP